MSKVEDAINAQKKRAFASGLALRSSPPGHPVRRGTAPLKLSGHSTVGFDAARMEHSCLLPYIRDKGATNAYKLLRTRLLQRMRENHWKSLIVTAPLPNDGKTTTAINLSIGASQDVSQSVLLVDFDLQRPSVAQCLGIERTTGLSDYLAGNADFHEIIYNTEIDRLALLPNFESFNTSESLASPRMLALLDYIKRLDPNLLIVFDMPPALASDDVLAFGPYVDALLLIVSEGRTDHRLLQRVNDVISGIPRVGTLLNRSAEGNSGYYAY